MLKQRARIVSFFLFLLDESVTLASFLAAYWLRAYVVAPAVNRPIYPLADYLFLLYFIFPAWGISFWFLGLYRSHRTISFGREVWEILRAVVAGGLVLSLVIFITKSIYISRSLMIIFLFVNAGALMAERAVLRAAGRVARLRGFNYRNILIVGIGRRAREFASLLEEHPSWGIKIVGYINPDGQEGKAVEEDLISGRLEDLADIIQETVVDEVIFVVPPSRLAPLEDAFLLCEEQGIKTRVVMEYLPRQMAKVYVEMVEGMPIMTMTTAPIDVTALFVKKVMDLVFSVILLVVTAPFLLIIAALVKFSSPGPVLFKQTRCGLNGRRFTLLKFRSMYRDAENRKEELAHLNRMDGPVFKAENDPRVTPAGKLLRAFSLDELPQLINVLKGDMSIVGPRPPIPEEVSQYHRWQRRRLSMKPGLTCLWQISGRSDLDFETWMKLDLEYIDNWSLWLDLKIILKTIPTVLSRRGAM